MITTYYIGVLVALVINAVILFRDDFRISIDGRRDYVLAVLLGIAVSAFSWVYVTCVGVSFLFRKQISAFLEKYSD